MKIYPMPLVYTELDSSFEFRGDIIIRYNFAPENELTIGLFEELWRGFTNKMTTVSFEPDGGLPENSFTVGGIMPQMEAGMEYALSVTDSGFGALADDGRGLTHAYMTLLQLIEPAKVDNPGFDRFRVAACEVMDKPALGMRSVHLTLDTEPGGLEIMRQSLRLAALLKYSHAIVEFMGSIKLDNLGDMECKNAYSKAEIRALFYEAEALGLEIIPMYNCFGHVVVANQNKYRALFEPSGYSHCMSNPDTRKMLKGVCRELIEMCGEGKYLHIGGDEAHGFGTCDVCIKTPVEELYAGFINEMTEEMRPLGRRVMIWGDSMLEHSRFRFTTDRSGRHYAATEGSEYNAYKTLDLIDKSVIICDWQYHIWDEDLKSSMYFTDKGFEVVTCSANEVDNANNTDAMAKTAKKHGYHGYMQTVWSTWGQQPVLLTRGAAASWMEDTSGYDKPQAGEEQFLREYKLMAHRTGDFLRKVYSGREYDYSDNGAGLREGSFMP